LSVHRIGSGARGVGVDLVEGVNCAIMRGDPREEVIHAASCGRATRAHIRADFNERLRGRSDQTR
jgi:hypothetical protein